MACGAPDHHRGAASTPSQCRSQPPVGDPSQLTLRSAAGFTISPPQTCSDGSYIRIERGTGARQLATGRGPTGGFDQGCMELAATAACQELVNPAALLRQVQVELASASVETAGLGMGPCAVSTANDYGTWNFATGVHDWKDADRLVAKITEVMDRFDIRGYVGASVYSIPCVEAL